MKLAHLILAHANPTQLLRLVTKLKHNDAHIFIHLDEKTDIQPFRFISDNKNVFFIKNRYRVYWGGYSIVQATVNSFEEILATGNAYDYINLLSGQDYPIKNVKVIHDFFTANPGQIFMNFLSVKNEWQEALPRIERYHLLNWHLPFGTYTAERMVNALLPVRHLPKGIEPVGRSQWFTATPESIAYIVQYVRDNRKIVEFFKLTWAPDEMIFHTILYNSEFRNKMVNDNLLYVDWSERKPSPKLLNMEDAVALRHSEKFFARKFNIAIDSKILDYLDELNS